MLPMLTEVLLSAASSSMKVTQTHNASSEMILVKILVERKIASLRLVELNTSLRMMMLSDVASSRVW